MLPCPTSRETGEPKYPAWQLKLEKLNVMVFPPTLWGSTRVGISQRGLLGLDQVIWAVCRDREHYVCIYAVGVRVWACTRNIISKPAIHA
jgi:hypothetical protein